jgi:aryl-alcohol dehydrogenase
MPERSGRWSLEELELADPGPREVLVRVVASGICQTDVHARDGYFPVPWPAVYGHEGTGVVERVGAAVKAVAPGDHVIMASPGCGECANCREGYEAYCVRSREIKLCGLRMDGSIALRRGETPVHGSFFQQSSFSTVALATEGNVIKVAPDAPLDILAAFPCGVNTGAGAVMNVLGPRPGDSLAVFGAGTVGLAGLMAAKLCGCDPIIAVDVFENRLALARELGATHVIDARGSDVAAEVRRLAGGRGVRQRCALRSTRSRRAGSAAWSAARAAASKRRSTWPPCSRAASCAAASRARASSGSSCRSSSSCTAPGSCRSTAWCVATSSPRSTRRWPTC